MITEDSQNLKHLSYVDLCLPFVTSALSFKRTSRKANKLSAAMRSLFISFLLLGISVIVTNGRHIPFHSFSEPTESLPGPQGCWS